MIAAASPQLLARPIMGGPFSSGRFALATVPCVSRGLHGVKYMVVDEGAGAVLAIADDKTEALSSARRLLTEAANVVSQLQAANDCGGQGELFTAEELPPTAPAATNCDRHISRRRRMIFEKSGGRCHYCATPIHLEGEWHIEHMLPRALGGTDDTMNLVASCAPCNLRKSDRTALEFMADAR